jgi:hypothetical protein
MATVGQQLTSPESGWKRYDDAHPAVVLEGSWYLYKSSLTGHYNNTVSLSEKTTNAKIRFLFYGTKIRIITSRYTDRSTDTKITIDGTIVETYNENGSGVTGQILAYEKTGLSLGVHTVEIHNQSGVGRMSLDAIDIDDTGRLLHPDEVLDPKDLDIGKRIRCHYQAPTSGQVGVFSGLCQETSDFIPPASSATPNGDFYFIVVDKDHLGRWKLIADRNIQHSISWDTLNSEGMTNTGREVNLNLNNYKFTIRLLTGGINSVDTDNEWNKYIVNSTLNGTITAGDNNVWNWSGIASWTSTTSSGGGAQRTTRGRTTVSNMTGTTSPTSNEYVGFRPVLLIEILIYNKSFIYINGEYKTWDNSNKQWITVLTSLPSKDIFSNQGIDDISILNRKQTTLQQTMNNNGTLGGGKVFKSTVDLNKYFDLISLNVK